MSAVPRRRRYYEGATTSHSASRPLLVRDRVPRGPPRVRARRSAPGRMEEPPEPGPFRPPEARFRLASAWTGWDLTGSQAIHPVPLPCSKTIVPATAGNRAHRDPSEGRAAPGAENRCRDTREGTLSPANLSTNRQRIAHLARTRPGVALTMATRATSRTGCSYGQLAIT